MGEMVDNKHVPENFEPIITFTFTEHDIYSEILTRRKCMSSKDWLVNL